jgi:hypothetical protein
MEVDLADGYQTVNDVDDMIAKASVQFATLGPQQQVVVAADWRPCKLFTPEVAERARQLLVGVSPHVERSGILHRADQAVSVLQVFRLAKECNFANRRVFTDAAQMEAWLAEVLNLHERARLRTFLAQRSY